MTECAYCRAIVKKTKLVYEDKHVAALLVSKPAAAGHLVVFPRSHYARLEDVPDYVTAHWWITANKLGAALFEASKAEGSNLFIQNGDAAGQSTSHVLMHVIPRRQGDSITFAWPPRQIPEEHMATIEIQIKEEAASIGDFEQEPTAPEKIGVQKRETKEEGKNDEHTTPDDYLVRHLHRQP